MWSEPQLSESRNPIHVVTHDVPPRAGDLRQTLCPAPAADGARERCCSAPGKAVSHTHLEPLPARAIPFIPVSRSRIDTGPGMVSGYGYFPIGAGVSFHQELTTFSTGPGRWQT